MSAASPPIAKIARQLKFLLDTECRRYPFAVHYALHHFATGSSIETGADVVLPSGSTRKVAILLTALRLVELGKLSLDQTSVLTDKDKVETELGSGILHLLKSGLKLTLHDLLVAMITLSDNSATSMVVGLLGVDAVNQLCKDAGMKHTLHRYGAPPTTTVYDYDKLTLTTAGDQTRLLALLADGAFGSPAVSSAACATLGCSRERCRYAVRIMTWQKIKHRLPSLLPEGTTVAHKTGTSGRMFADTGIVFARRSSKQAPLRPLFALSVYCQNVPKEVPVQRSQPLDEKQHAALRALLGSSNGDGVPAQVQPQALPLSRPGKRSAFDVMGRLARMSFDVFSRLDEQQGGAIKSKL